MPLASVLKFFALTARQKSQENLKTASVHFASSVKPSLGISAQRFLDEITRDRG
jgi:hypothetical protein